MKPFFLPPAFSILSSAHISHSTSSTTLSHRVSCSCANMTLAQMHTCHPFPFTNGSGEHRSYSYVSHEEEEEAYHSGGIYVHKIERGPSRMSEPIRPHVNDVLLGRGGKNNQHSGNEKLREIARGHSDDYRTSTKKGKSYISRQLVQKMRELTPPSR